MTTASSASAMCDASGCSSCALSGTVNICVNYTAPPPPPTCLLPCAQPACPNTTCTTNCDATCGVCVRAATALVGACVSATVGTGVILTSQSSLDAGFDLSLFDTPPIVTVDAQASGNVAGNAIVTLAGASAIANLNVGSGFTSGAMFQVNSSISVTSWNNNAGSAKVDNNCGALVIGSLTLGGSYFSVFQNCSQAVFTCSNIDFTSRGMFSGAATLHIAGGVAHIGTQNGANVSGSGTLKLSGGVSIDGSLPQGVTVNVAAAGKSAPLVVVDASTNWNISGNVQGSGVIAVNGQLILGSTTASVDPKVVVNAGATLVINSATALQAKAVDISAQATLVLGASAKKGAIFIDKMAKCLGLVQIKLDTTASVFISGTSAGAGVGFTYSSSNNPSDLANCAVEVVDSAGVTFQLTSSASASAGRRLLASGGTATWGPNQMTYTMGQQQASSATPLLLLGPILVSGALGLLM